MGRYHTRIPCNLPSCHYRHQSLPPMLGLMLMFLTMSQAYHRHLYPLKQNGHPGSRQRCFLHNRHLCHHLVNHRSCHHQNQQVHWMHHLGQSHMILQGHLPIHQGLYQIAEHHRFHRCHHRLVQRIGLLNQNYT